MNTGFVPLLGRAESIHTHLDSLSDIKSQPIAKNTVESLSPSLTLLHRARLATQEVVEPYFNANKFFIEKDLYRLNGKRFTSWFKIENLQLIILTKKAALAAYKTLLILIEEERLHEYLQACWRKMKDNFRQFHLKLRHDREIKKESEINDHLKENFQ